MKKNMKVAILGAELTPLAKVGGLGDVMGALPKTMFELGVDVVTFVPFYGSIKRDNLKLELVSKDLPISSGGGFNFSVWQTKIPGSEAKLYLLEHPYFSGQDIYSHEQLVGKDLLITEFEKFITFSQAALLAMKAIDFVPDVVHLNDWHTSAFLAFLEDENKNSSFFAKTRTIFTIHNLANQGQFPVADLCLPINDVVLSAQLSEGIINFMAMGILGADIINTVSKTYAAEILGTLEGEGLESILQKRKTNLYGVVNGIDVVAFDPSTDPALWQTYNFNSIEKKVINKLNLQKLLGLTESGEIPVFGLVSRLVNQKGLDLLDEKIANLNAQFIFLGTGQKEVEEKVSNWAQKYPNKIKAIIGFDAKLAQQIYAGADIFLMPSKFEPCGLGQLIAMRYGTLPLVRKTGGLKDTVSAKVGFLFKNYEAKALAVCINKIIKLYSDKDGWKTRQKLAMSGDYSWLKPAKKYLKIYKKALTLNKTQSYTH